MTDIRLTVHVLVILYIESHWGVTMYHDFNRFSQSVGRQDCTSVQVKSCLPHDSNSITFLSVFVKKNPINSSL